MLVNSVITSNANIRLLPMIYLAVSFIKSNYSTWENIVPAYYLEKS